MGPSLLLLAGRTRIQHAQLNIKYTRLERMIFSAARVADRYHEEVAEPGRPADRADEGRAP